MLTHALSMYNNISHPVLSQLWGWRPPHQPGQLPYKKPGMTQSEQQSNARLMHGVDVAPLGLWCHASWNEVHPGTLA